MMNKTDPAWNLRALRDSVDNIDAAIVHMLAERFKCTNEIALLQARHGLRGRDIARGAQQISRLRHLAAVSRLDPDFVEMFLGLIVARTAMDHGAGLPHGSSAPSAVDARADRPQAAP